MDEFGRYTGQGEVTIALRNMGACLHYFIFGGHLHERHAVAGPFDHNEKAKGAAERKARRLNRHVYRDSNFPVERGGYAVKFVEQGERYLEWTVGLVHHRKFGPMGLIDDEIIHGCSDVFHLPPEY